MRVSLRSKGEIDVSAVAASFGGGGHKNASGLHGGRPVETLRPDRGRPRVVGDRGRPSRPGRESAAARPVQRPPPSAAPARIAPDRRRAGDRQAAGPTSHDVVARVRRICRLGEGSATRARSTPPPPACSRWCWGGRRGWPGSCPRSTKTYEAAIRLGRATSTFDGEDGPIGPAWGGLGEADGRLRVGDRAAVEGALATLAGTYEQAPPCIRPRRSKASAPTSWRDRAGPYSRAGHGDGAPARDLGPSTATCAGRGHGVGRVLRASARGPARPASRRRRSSSRSFGGRAAGRSTSRGGAPRGTGTGPGDGAGTAVYRSTNCCRSARPRCSPMGAERVRHGHEVGPADMVTEPETVAGSVRLLDKAADWSRCRSRPRAAVFASDRRSGINSRFGRYGSSVVYGGPAGGESRLDRSWRIRAWH